jgi:chaperonin cofactor prefoldin
MFTAKESTQFFEMSRRLRELHIRKAAAQSKGDREQIDELQAEIDALTNDCNNVLDAETAV